MKNVAKTSETLRCQSLRWQQSIGSGKDTQVKETQTQVSSWIFSHISRAPLKNYSCNLEIFCSKHELGCCLFFFFFFCMKILQNKVLNLIFMIFLGKSYFEVFVREGTKFGPKWGFSILMKNYDSEVSWLHKVTVLYKWRLS